jgi:diacylglycerol kinase family enzyme
MSGKRACLVVDLRTGEHVAKVPDIVTVFAAAGWKTDVVLKMYSGETVKLAQKAARDGYDVVLGFGGDGTFNAVFNGVFSEGGKSLVAVIPGGTYNTWAGELDIPTDPVKAALAIVNSEARRIDLGHIEVDGLTLPGDAAQRSAASAPKKHKKPVRSTKNQQYFLLNVGMGLDAAMMAHISKPLKYRVGPLAFNLALLKELPEQRPFPVVVQASYDRHNVATHWQGEVWEVFVSKVPLFGGDVSIEPDARADDGQLHVALITANGPMRTIEQVFSLVAQRKFDDTTTQFFKAPHFSISIPASIAVHVDGGVIKLEDFLHKSDLAALEQARNSAEVMVNYRFDAQPEAVSASIPRTYSGSLFTHPPHKEADPAQFSNGTRWEQAQHDDTSAQKTLYTVKVIGSAPNPEQQNTSIVAGSITKEDTDVTETVALSVNGQTPIFDNEKGQLAPASVLELQEGARINVRGDKNKRNVIRASRINISH